MPFDYVIVGAGSAGCVLASRLSEDSATTVLLLEAGPADRKLEIRIPAAFSKLFRSEVDWDYATAPADELGGRSVYWPRGRTLGGSSSINAQMYVRGDRVDFDGWAAAGNPGWSYAEVLDAFVRSERNSRGRSPHHGDDGPMHVSDLRDPHPLSLAFVRAATGCGIPANADMNGERLDGVGLTQVTQRRGRRESTATAFLRPARRRRNLTVRTGVQVTRMVFDGRRAVGVEHRGADGSTAMIEARREVILSAGAIGSPHLLLLSGVGPARQLQEHGIGVVLDHPGVGANLADHFATGVRAEVNRTDTLAAAERLPNLLRFLLLGRGPLTSNVAEVHAFVRTRPELPAADLELLFAPVLFVGEGLVPPPGHGITLAAVALQPRARGRIELASPDPLVKPAIHAGYLSEAEDLAVLVHGLRLARRILSTAPLAAEVTTELTPGSAVDTDAELADYIRSDSQTLYHPVGTCAMGTGPDAVVDAQLRVHGLDRLRVIDASVMPTIIRGHTNAATIMIAERAAELMRAAASASADESAAGSASGSATASGSLPASRSAGSGGAG
jgi:choline dehydrogenase-like flavoprotein